MEKAERKHVYSTEFFRTSSAEEILNSLIAESGAQSGKCLIHVIDDIDNENAETTGCVVVWFADNHIVSARYDYNAVVKELTRDMDYPYLRIEIVELEVVEEEA